MHVHGDSSDTLCITDMEAQHGGGYPFCRTLLYNTLDLAKKEVSEVHSKIDNGDRYMQHGCIHQLHLA